MWLFKIGWEYIQKLSNIGDTIKGLSIFGSFFGVIGIWIWKRFRKHSSFKSKINNHINEFAVEYPDLFLLQRRCQNSEEIKKFGEKLDEIVKPLRLLRENAKSHKLKKLEKGLSNLIGEVEKGKRAHFGYYDAQKMCQNEPDKGKILTSQLKVLNQNTDKVNECIQGIRSEL